VIFNKDMPVRNLTKATPFRELNETEDLIEPDQITKQDAVQKLRKK
jgi:hypothetical protein